MKSKIVVGLSALLLFIAGTIFGGFVGVSGASGSNVSQLFAGAVELRSVGSLIEQKKYAQAQALICSSLQTRLAIMDNARPFLATRKQQEIESFSQQVLARAMGDFTASTEFSCAPSPSQLD